MNSLGGFRSDDPTDPDEVAELVAFLASEPGLSITGSEYVMTVEIFHDLSPLSSVSTLGNGDLKIRPSHRSSLANRSEMERARCSSECRYPQTRY